MRSVALEPPFPTLPYGNAKSIDRQGSLYHASMTMILNPVAVVLHCSNLADPSPEFRQDGSIRFLERLEGPGRSLIGDRRMVSHRDAEVVH